MNNAEFQLRGVGDPRLAVHATSAMPAWLWSIDGTRILWANPVGARLLGAANGAALAQKSFGPADPHRRQVARLAGKLPSTGTVGLERLRGFGARLGMLVTCACSRLDFADGGHGILVAAAEPVGRAMPLVERLQRLVEGIDTPIAAFARDGMFVGASDAARALLGFRNLSEAGLEEARSDALKQGRVETPIGIGHMVLQRVGSGADVGLVALIAPGAIEAMQVGHVAPADPVATPTSPESPGEPAHAIAPAATRAVAGYEQPASSGQAPAEFALIDELLEPLAAPVEAAPREPAYPPAEQPTADDEQPVGSGGAPAGFARIHAFADLSAAATKTETIVPEAMPEAAVHEDEPSPQVEAVADQPATPPAAEPPPVAEPPASTPGTAAPVKAPSWLDEPAPVARRHPLRFMWQMDVEGRFLLGTDEFTRLIGANTALGFGRLWSEIAEAFRLDPDNRVLKAIATRNTWSGVTLNWPIDGGERLPVELSGLPVYDRARNFAGYRGFGVCRDIDGLTRLAALRRFELFSSPPVQADPAQGPPSYSPAEPDVASIPPLESPTLIAVETSHQNDLEPTVETPKNVLPFRPLGEPKLPVLTPVENNAFNELARQLSARLEGENRTPAATPVIEHPSEMLAEQPAPPETRESETPEPEVRELEACELETPAPISEQPNWLAPPEPPARGASRRDRALLDLIPVGVLIYRLDRLLYANGAFLERIGYASLHALEEAGGLDALYVEPGVSSASSTSDTGTPVTISATQALSERSLSERGSSEHPPPASTDARLYTISWDDEQALALICSNGAAQGADIAAAIARAEPVPEPPSAVGHANAEELGAILDTAAEGIVMFDVEGSISSCNRSAEALFGYDGDELVRRNLAELFAPESQRVLLDYLDSINGAGVASLLEHGREALGRERGGGLIPLSITMGRTRPDGPNFFAVFRDLSQTKKTESELQQARRLADRAANAKADMLARISHEVRTPLNAIIGFAEVMIGERFGVLGNERYVEYMKDIRASGERVIAIINDLLDLSRIETGKLDLAFTSQNLNDLVESCVAVMQPQANRERIIIRTSLAHALPPVVADARALRQITLNLIGNSIHLANAGGQVIVSTALSDFGEVVLRVRDTGHGLNDNEVAAAMEPFRTHPPSDQTSDSSGVSLSLTKALVEANRAQFHIRTGAHSGTLIEVVFSQAMARA
jgi:PAS domain S-box-containing protein